MNILVTEAMFAGGRHENLTMTMFYKWKAHKDCIVMIELDRVFK